MNDFITEFCTSDICVVSFASDSQQLFEFGMTLRSCNVAHVLFRDVRTKWYQHGVMGIGDRPAVVTYLQRLTHRYSYVKTLGISSGAYAALLYGQLAAVDEVIAISPVTGKEVDDFDPKWHKYILPQPGIPDPSPIDDLRQFFKEGLATRVSAFVSTGFGAEVDFQMVTRIGVPDKDITIIPGYEHSTLARHMRDTGLLQQVIMRKPNGA